MRLIGEGKLLRIFVGETDRCEGRPLYEVIVHGATSRIHTAKILRLSEGLPLVIDIVDSEEKIRAALPALDALMEASGGGGLVTLEKAEVIKYVHGTR